MKRKDIQVLRAIAVLLVVAYHVGVPISSGFLGVDIFFVISGFVISAAFLNELSQSSKIQVISFYWKRYKRLIPNLAIMVVTVCIISLFTLSPLGAIQITAVTGIGSLFSAANMVIAYSTGGYFSPPAANNPLTHTWSLAVEEQFYLILPLLIVIISKVAHKKFKLTKKIIFITILFLSLISIISAIYDKNLDPLSLKSEIAGYYSPISRIWEFGFGVMAALITKKTPRKNNLGIFLYGSILLLIIAVLMPAHYFNLPGVFTLIPVLSTTGIILSRSYEQKLLRNIFENRSLTWIGDRSYSIYLWHWPFIVFSKFLFPDNHLAIYIGVLLSLVPAFLIYRLIENPLHISRGFTSTKSKVILILQFTLVSAVFTAGIGFVAQDIMRPTLKDSSGFYDGQIGEPEYYKYIAEHFPKCGSPSMQSLAQIYPGGYLRCQQSKPDAAPVEIAIIGDSHAEDLFFGLAKNLPNKNVAFFIQGLPVKTDPTMNKIIDYVSRTPSIKIVVINSSWASRGLPESEISRTLQELINAGKKVFIGDDRPFFADPSTCKYGVGGFGLSMYCTKGINYETSLQNSYLPKIHDLLKKFPALHFLPMFREFCNSKECSMIDKQKILYRDWTHLNISGSVYLWNKLFINPKIKNEFIR